MSTTRNKFCFTYKHVCIFIGGKIETNIYLEQPFHIPIKTWKYGGSVFDTEAAEGT